MVTFVLTFVAGLVVGWHVPQPSWAKKAEEKAVATAKKAAKKK